MVVYDHSTTFLLFWHIIKFHCYWIFTFILSWKKTMDIKAVCLKYLVKQYVLACCQSPTAIGPEKINLSDLHVKYSAVPL